MKRILGLVLGGFLFLSSQVVHATMTEAEPGLTLLSHYEFTELSEANRAKYLEALTQLMVKLEKRQEEMGVKYSTAANTQFNNWWSALIETAEAQTVVKKGAACIYAGGMSAYASSNRYTCLNNRKCEGKPKLIECNPLLFGEGACTEAKDGATARCVRNKKVSNADLAKILAAGEKRKEWDSFKAEFDAFCPGVLKRPKDINYKSCKLVEQELLAVQKEIDKVPAAAAVAAPAAPVDLKPEVSTGACGRAGSGSCMQCPPPDVVKEYRDVTAGDLGADKYSQLVRIMANACGVNNASDSGNGPSGVSAKTLDQMVKKFGLCGDADYEGMNKYTKTGYKGEEEDGKQKAIIESLVGGNSSAVKELAGGRWFNENSEAMQDYFGLNIKDARQVFCTSASPDAAVGILRGYPEFGFLSGTGVTGTELASILKDDKFLTSVPSSFPTQEWNNVDGPPVIALNKFKKQVARRQKLADCLAKNTQDPQRRKRLMLVNVPRTCNLETYTVDAANFGATLQKSVRENGVTCVVGLQGNPSGSCYQCDDGGCRCKGTAELKGPAKISSLRCSGPAPGTRHNTPSGNPPPGSSSGTN